MDKSGDLAEPISRKEIFDYLRNVQKETEIRARLSGINIWVIFGAMGVIVWALLDPTKSILSEKVFLWATVICQIFIVTINLGVAVRVQGSRSDLRFLPAWMASRTDLALFWATLYAIFSAPFIVCGVLWGFTVGTAVFSLVMSLLILSELFGKADHEDANRLFGKSKSSKIFAVGFFFVILFSIVYDNVLLWTDPDNWLSRLEVKTVFLIVALYFLLLLLNQRKLADNLDAWTYELEKKIILGLCTNEEALRAIENQQLGARLISVIEKKKSSLVSKGVQLEKELESMRLAISNIEKISREYMHERRAQHAAATKAVENSLSELEGEFKNLESFSKKLRNRNIVLKEASIDQLLIEVQTDLESYKSLRLKVKDELVRDKRRLEV
ncbi:hypothetical protein [Massilia timonae]|uniref:Putative membrane protein n=1 Tax=Massilia timonae TaxID=47229 RepID=A0A1S2NEI1_9BURK|nr:hypothetical protein [Massilia timonae]OIJ43468.1 putative membrane protein [Massilia timonae]